MDGGALRRQTMRETINKLTVFLTCLCVALAVGWGVTQHKLTEARQTVDRQERQLKELYGQVNELTLQYVEIVKRIQTHGDKR
jgi:cell division protein FtsL